MKDLLNEQPELSSDLEWMLQSGQVGKEVLGEALIAEYYAPVFRLALALLDDEELAQAAALETFRAALSKLEGYRSSRSVLAWIFRLAVEASRAARRRSGLLRLFRQSSERPSQTAIPNTESAPDLVVWAELDRMDETGRLIVILAYVFGWETGDIAALLKKSESQVEGRLSGAGAAFRSGLHGYAGKRGPHPEHLAEAAADRLARQSLERRWPPVQITPGELRWAGEAVLRDLDRRASRRFSNLAGEFVSVGAIALLVIGLIWGGNRFLAEPEPLPTATPRSRAQAQDPKTEPGSQPGPTRTPSPTATTETSPTPAALMTYLASPGESLRSIAEKLGISLEQLAAHNRPRRLDEIISEAQEIVVPLGPGYRAATPTPVRTPDLRLEPLSAGASSEGIYSFLMLSERLWNTLWVDAAVINYGPAGYVGQPLAARQQVWVSQPGQSKVLIGPMAGRPQYHWLTSGGWYYFKEPGSRHGFMQAVDAVIPDVALLQDQIYPSRAQWLQQEGRFVSVGEEERAGRQAVIVDWYNAENQRERRLWVDRGRGVILGQDRYSTLDEGTLVESIHFSQVVFDKDLPAMMFDPRQDWTSGFSSNYLGGSRESSRADGPRPGGSIVFEPAPGHEPISRPTPPSRLDPSASRLTFQYPGNSAIETTPGATPPRVELFADQDHLGWVSFARPWGLKCDRSPDGLKIAFYSQAHWLEFGGSWTPPSLQWFSLMDLAHVNTPNIFIEPVDFAFAPDSRRLAVTGYGPDGNKLYILDLESGEIEGLLDLDYGISLVWSPGGDFLALIGSRTGWPDMRGMVVDVATGRINYEIQLDYNPSSLSDLYPGSEWPSITWPANNWGVKFPILDRGLEECILPPQSAAEAP